MTEFCIHAANVCYLFSFLGRDMLWLRTLTCVGLLLGVIFFACQPAPMYGPAAWHVAFLLINIVQIGRLVLERRRLLTEEQEEVGELMFEEYSHEELVDLATHVVHTVPKDSKDVEDARRKPLTEEQKLVRDLVLSGLSRKDLLILLTRRTWSFLKKINPLSWRRKKQRPILPTPESSGIR